MISRKFSARGRAGMILGQSVRVRGDDEVFALSNLRQDSGSRWQGGWSADIFEVIDAVAAANALDESFGKVAVEPAL